MVVPWRLLHTIGIMSETLDPLFADRMERLCRQGRFAAWFAVGFTLVSLASMFASIPAALDGDYNQTGLVVSALAFLAALGFVRIARALLAEVRNLVLLHQAGGV